MGYQGTYCFDAFESRSQSAIGLLNGVHGCGASPEFWGEPLSAEDMLPVIPMTDTLEISGTIATITTTLPVTVTNLEQDGQMAVITSTETVTITGTISPTEAISGTGWVRTRGLASMLPPKWLMAPAGQDGGSNPGTSLVMDIDYTYDPLYRLTDAVYNGGYYSFKYLYDAVGNRTQMVSGPTSSQVITTNYGYDIANHLTSVDGVTYTWDNNGNLLDDGLNTYTYDQANRLTSVMSMPSAASFTYNGLGDRVQQNNAGNTTTYLLDIASGLTQVLADGESTYLYGLGRIGEEGGAGWQYHHGDALGSVRQLTDPGGAITLAKNYRPYGDLLSSAGDVDTPYDFAGEWRDDSGLIHLRARYYEPTVGRFISRDPWQGDLWTPMSYNLWAYAYANPIRYTDPSGEFPWIPLIALAIYFAVAIPGDSARYDLPPGNQIVGDLSMRVASDPYDFLRTVQDCINCTCSWLDVVSAFVPFIPGGIRKIDNIFVETTRPIFKSFTKWNFRENLRLLTGKIPDDIVKLEAHHVFPQEFTPDFTKAGINVHDPVFGSWVDATLHRGWSNAYNEQWRKFLAQNPTRNEILVFAKRLAKEYGFDVHFDVP